MASVEISITHEVKIDRDSSWVKLSINEEVPDGVEVDTFIDRLALKVNEKLIDIIEQTVDTVRNYTPTK